MLNQPGSLGISSPTPSAEALFAMLGFAGERDWLVGAADISAAFMATPLRTRKVVAKLPASITSISGEALYLWLSKALNGTEECQPGSGMCTCRRLLISAGYALVV